MRKTYHHSTIGMKRLERTLGRLEVFQFHPWPLMLQDIFAGIKYLNAYDGAIGSIVKGDVFRNPLCSYLESAFFESDIRSVDLGIIADFHCVRLLKIKNVNGYDNNRFFFPDDRHDLFNTVKLVTPLAIILKIMAITHAAVFGGDSFAMVDCLDNLFSGRAAFQHLF